MLTELEKDEPTLEVGTVVGTRVIRQGRIQNLESSAHRGHGRVASGTADNSAQNTINRVSTHVGNSGRQPYSNPTLSAQFDLLMGADTAPEAEAGNRAAIFRSCISGVPPLIVVRTTEDGGHKSAQVDQPNPAKSALVATATSSAIEPAAAEASAIPAWATHRPAADHMDTGSDGQQQRRPRAGSSGSWQRPATAAAGSSSGTKAAPRKKGQQTLAWAVPAVKRAKGADQAVITAAELVESDGSGSGNTDAGSPETPE